MASSDGFYKRGVAMRPVLRNFRVITETSPEQLSLKLPPVKAETGARRVALKAAAVAGTPRRDTLQKITAEIVAIIGGTRGNVSI